MKLRACFTTIILLASACSNDDDSSSPSPDGGNMPDSSVGLRLDGGLGLDASIDAGSGSPLDASAPHADAGLPKWNYEGIKGPSNWATLDPTDRGLCADATNESPIDLPTSPATDLPDEVVAYAPSQVSITDTGHTEQFNYDAGSKVTLDGVEYALVQFHFHHHSEHTVAGAMHPLELHLVHQDVTGKKLVIGVFIDEGPANALLSAVWSKLPTVEGVTYTDRASHFNIKDLLPSGDSWRYTGSLTAPPCSEDVRWLIYKTPITFSSAQIAAFGALYPDNFRPLQPLGSRTVSFGH